jgi:PKD repeat protein
VRSSIIILSLILFCLCLVLPAGADEGLIHTSDQDIRLFILPEYHEMEPSNEVVYSLLMPSTPQGLAGYWINLSLSTSDVAEIISVEFPAWADLKRNSTLPGYYVHCDAVDLTNNAGSLNISLFSVRVRANAGGVATLFVSSDSYVDDRDGGRTHPVVSPAVLNVGGFPIANFTALPTNGSAPLTVQFTDHSLGDPGEFTWDFGDTTTSMEEHPVRTYEIPGVYTVSLKVTNEHGSHTVRKDHYISVSGLPTPPTADFSAEPTRGYTPLAVQFTDLSAGNPTHWFWEFGDGTDSVEQNPSKQYVTPGVYTVSLTVTNADGNNTRRKEHYVEVTEPPTPGYYLFDRSFGSSGAGASQFNSPFGIVSRYPDEIIVADRDNYRIQIFKETGDYIRMFGGRGLQPGQFENPQDVALDSDGTLYVTDAGTHRISVFDTNGTFYRSFGGEGGDSGMFRHPSGVAVNSSGYLYVADSSNHRISVFDSDGNFVRVFGSEGSGSAQFRFPQGVAIDRNDIIYVADRNNNRVLAFDSIGTLVRTYGPGLPGDGVLKMPHDVCISPFEELLVTDTGNGRIAVFHIDGEYIGSFGSANLLSPSGITVNRSGAAYVTDFDRNAVFVYLPSTHGSPPKANFTAYPVSGPAPLTVCFNDTSTRSPTGWEWSFGDGTSSLEEHPKKIYTLPGRYTVKLTASNPGGNNTLIVHEYITVHMRGDLNRNERIDIGDVAKVAYMAIGLIEDDPEARFEGKETVTCADAARIAYYYVGSIPSL